MINGNPHVSKSQLHCSTIPLETLKLQWTFIVIFMLLYIMCMKNSLPVLFLILMLSYIPFYPEDKEYKSTKRCISILSFVWYACTWHVFVHFFQNDYHMYYILCTFTTWSLCCIVHCYDDNKCIRTHVVTVTQVLYGTVHVQAEDMTHARLTNL